MHLKRLEIQGFKSFANKTTLEFDRGIIAIVGPNGSGKSNVADSLRWVLGEQSTKLIRGKSSQDVIFAGSEKKTKMGFAEVVATFDNSDRRIPVDAPEVSIGRRIDRSGESEYLLNGAKVRLLDIVDLVLRSNIGTSRYTVIGQGTIDQMILAGPSEVKNLLDEASGVKNYYLKRERTLRRLEQTAQNLMRAEDLIKEIEPRLKSLRRQAKRMEARAEIEQELKQYQREFFGKTYSLLRKQLDGVEAQLAAVGSKRQHLEASIAEHRKSLEKNETESVSQNAHVRKLQEDLQKLHNHKNKLLEDLSLVRGKMQSHKTAAAGDAPTLQVELHGKNRKIQELETTITAQHTQQQKVEHSLAAQRASLTAVNNKLDKVYEVIQNPSQVDWVAFDRELVHLETSVHDFLTVVDQGQSLEDVRVGSAKFRQAFSTFSNLAKETVSGPQVNMQHMQAQLQELLKERDVMNSHIQTSELELSKAKLSLEFLHRELTQENQQKLHLELELKKAQSGSLDSFVKDLISEEDRIKKEVEAQGKEITQLEQHVTAFYHQEEAKQKHLHQAESVFRGQQDELSKVRDQESQIQIEKAKLDTQMSVLVEEIVRILGSHELAELQKQTAQGHTEDLEGKIMRLKNQLDMIGGMDELTLKEYQETETRHTNLSSQVADLKQSMDDLRHIMDELDEHIKTRFNEAFHKINEKFEYYFRILFNGGRATLGIVKAENPTEEVQAQEGEEETAATDQQLRPEEKVIQKYEKGGSHITGIDVKATPPGKKLSSLQALSGGERSLTSIALLCSLLTCFPSPFVVLDEVDAALDDANTIRFAQILSTLANQAQFVTITHNRETMAHANILYGVTMGDDGISKLLSVKLEQAKQFAK